MLTPLPSTELIGEEIYDEFDSEGHSRLSNYPAKRKGSRHEHGTPHPGSETPHIPMSLTASPLPLVAAPENLDAHAAPMSRTASTLGAAITSIRKKQPKVGQAKPKVSGGQGATGALPRTNSAPPDMHATVDAALKEGDERIPEKEKNDAPDL